MKLNTKDFFRAETARVVAHKALYRFLLAIACILAWDLLVNRKDLYSIWDIGFFTAGIFFLGLAWKDYLQLDGVRLNGFQDMKLFQKRKKKSKVNKSMVDYVDEGTPQLDGLNDRDEKLACLFGNLIAGGIYVVASLVYCFLHR